MRTFGNLIVTILGGMGLLAGVVGWWVLRENTSDGESDGYFAGGAMDTDMEEEEWIGPDEVYCGGYDAASLGI